MRSNKRKPVAAEMLRDKEDPQKRRPETAMRWWAISDTQRELVIGSNPPLKVGKGES